MSIGEGTVGTRVIMHDVMLAISIVIMVVILFRTTAMLVIAIAMVAVLAS